MTTSIIIAGVGGQGIVLASRLLAQAALRRGETARTAETIGMAQRGGSVVSHVRIGREVHSPLVPRGTAAAIIGLEPGEAVRCLPYLAPSGIVIVNAHTVAPVTALLAGQSYDGGEMIAHAQRHATRVLVVDGLAVAAEIGSTKVLNVALLGAAAAAGVPGASLSELEEAIKATLPERLVAMNLLALHAGARYAVEETTA